MSGQNTVVQRIFVRKIGTVILVSGALSFLTTAAFAAQDIEYARVVDVQPIVESVQVSEPVEKCWTESQPVQNSYSNSYSNSGNGGYNSVTPNIVGAIIGGVIGNQFGSGSGKGVATVAGAVLGGSVANDIKYQNRYSGSTTGYRNVERCELTQQQHREERIVAYDVSYRYNGKVFHTQMDHRPGDEIKVAVNVVPIP